MARKRRTEHRSKGTVQRFNESIEHSCMGLLPDPLPRVAETVLLVLGSGGVASQAAIQAKVVKSAVSYWKNRLVKAGALIPVESESPETLGKPGSEQKIGPGLPKYYRLTPFGSKLLTGSDVSGRLPVVFEDYPVKFHVLRWERVGSIDWVKLGSPRNWVKLGFRVTGVRVVRTSRSVIIHPGPIKGFDVDAVEVESGRIIERVRYILEVQFGMQLAEEPEYLHEPMWQVFRPEARAWIAQGGKVKVNGVGNLDASPKPSKGGVRDPLSNRPHVEFHDKRDAALACVWPPVASDPAKQNASDAPLYPMYLREVHEMVSGLVCRVDSLAADVDRSRNFEVQVSQLLDDLRRLSGALSKLENLEGIFEKLKKISGLLSKLFDVENFVAEHNAKIYDGGVPEYVC
jgi:hypothetical protein